MSTKYQPETVEYKGITLNIEYIPHDDKRDKVSVAFTVNDNQYQNAKFIPHNSTDEVFTAALEELKTWSHTIIDDNADGGVDKPKKS